MSMTVPKRLSLLAFILLVPGLLFFAWWGWQGQGENLRLEQAQILHFEEVSAHRVTKGLGDELFHLENSVGLGLSRISGDRWPGAAGPVLDAYLDLARHPDLLQEAYWVEAPVTGPWRWSRWSRSGWDPGPMPGWYLGSQAVLDRNPDPLVSLDSPWFTFMVPPDKSVRRALVVRYSLKTILDTIVPELVGKSFGASRNNPAYEVLVVRQTLTSGPGAVDSDLTVPLVGQERLSAWVRNYLASAADPTEVPPVPGLQWTLSVKYRPGGLASFAKNREAHNLYWAVGVSAFVLGGFALFLVSVVLRLRASRRDRVFAALVCHELKTPLAAVRALAENLSEGIVTDVARVRDYGARIGEQTLCLEEMVGNLMSLSRGGDKPGIQVPGPVDLGGLARSAAGQAGVLLKVPDGPGDWGALGTSASVRAALDNLLTNAFKFGGRDGRPPEVSMSLHRRSRWGVRWVGVSVSDHGAPRRFLRRLQARKGAGFGGGLGLALVRETQRRQGGRIGVRPVPGGGLCFTLWLREGPQP